MVAQGCVDCHNSHPQTPKTGWKLGDVRGVLKVESDISAAVADGQAVEKGFSGDLSLAGGEFEIARLPFSSVRNI